MLNNAIFLFYIMNYGKIIININNTNIMTLDCPDTSGDFYDKVQSRICNDDVQNQMQDYFDDKIKDYLSKET
jgi:hypothetical protein